MTSTWVCELKSGQLQGEKQEKENQTNSWSPSVDKLTNFQIAIGIWEWRVPLATSKNDVLRYSKLMYGIIWSTIHYRYSSVCAILLFWWVWNQNGWWLSLGISLILNSFVRWWLNCSNVSLYNRICLAYLYLSLNINWKEMVALLCCI